MEYKNWIDKNYVINRGVLVINVDGVEKITPIEGYPSCSAAIVAVNLE